MGADHDGAPAKAIDVEKGEEQRLLLKDERDSSNKSLIEEPPLRFGKKVAVSIAITIFISVILGIGIFAIATAIVKKIFAYEEVTVDPSMKWIYTFPALCFSITLACVVLVAIMALCELWVPLSGKDKSWVYVDHPLEMIFMIFLFSCIIALSWTLPTKFMGSEFYLALGLYILWQLYQKYRTAVLGISCLGATMGTDHDGAPAEAIDVDKGEEQLRLVKDDSRDSNNKSLIEVLSSRFGKKVAASIAVAVLVSTILGIGILTIAMVTFDKIFSCVEFTSNTDPCVTWTYTLCLLCLSGNLAYFVVIAILALCKLWVPLSDKDKFLVYVDVPFRMIFTTFLILCDFAFSWVPALPTNFFAGFFLVMGVSMLWLLYERYRTARLKSI